MQQRLHACLAILILSALTHTSAQLSFGGRPFGPGNPQWTSPTLTLPTVDAAALAAEDAHQLAAGVKGPHRFGSTHTTDISLDNAGRWHLGAWDGRVWQVRLHCPEAMGIGVSFSEFVIPEGGRVFIYNDEGTVLGGYTAASHPGHTVLGVQPIPGEWITVEYQEPWSVRDLGRLKIGGVTHVYRAPWPGFAGEARDFGDSGSCNINTICPLGDDWRPEIRSVALILAGGGTCTGQLLNNCNNDSIPYFLTANHCLAGGDPATWVFRFLWESPTCDPTQNAPTDQTLSGSTQLVANPPTDMLFLQLDQQPPPEFDAYYNGWDASGTFPDSTTCIHHPMGDIKKISQDTVAPGQANVDVGNGPADCWHIFNWDFGTTEPGSSGSGLWNQDHRIVGQLYGGSANCSNNVDDYFGRFDLSYPLLEQWLGGCDTLNGLDPGYTEPEIQYNTAITSIDNVAANVCNDSTIAPLITLKNNGVIYLGTVTIAFAILGGSSSSILWTGDLAPGETANVQLPPLAILNGPQTLVVETSQPNGQQDQDTSDDSFSLDFVASMPGELVTLELIPDNFGEDITWTLENAFGTIMYAGGPYPNENTNPIIREFCLGDGCYTFTIEDEFGDGICCNEGNGSYTITSAFGTHHESDGQYGDGEVVEFCLLGVGIPEPAPGTIEVYPNPTNGQVTVQLPMAVSGPVIWEVHDVMGRRLSSGSIGSGSTRSTIELGGLANGGYTLRCLVDGRWMVKTILLRH